MNKRITRPYFAHAVNSYDTPIERAMLVLIAFYFDIPVENIENPNQPRHQAGYTAWAARANQADTNHRGMNYFYDEVLPACDSCVAMPFLDGLMGLGVAGETNWFIKKNLPAFLVIAAEKITHTALRCFEANPLSGPFAVRLLTGAEKKLLTANDPRLVVPHEETRLRTFLVYGKEKRPFETAHFVSLPVPEGFYPDKK